MSEAHPAPRAAVVVLAAGEGRRVGAGRNKVLLPLAGEPVLVHSVRTAAGTAGVGPVVVVVRAEERDTVTALLSTAGLAERVEVVPGGATRHASEWHAVQALAPRIEAGEVDVVAVHDAARPLAPAELFARVVDTARDCGGAVPGVTQPALLDRDRGTLHHERLVAVQTPQAFAAAPLLAAYRAAAATGFEGTDTAACLEEFAGAEIRHVASSPLNLKVTFPEDVALAEALRTRLSR